MSSWGSSRRASSRASLARACSPGPRGLGAQAREPGGVRAPGAAPGRRAAERACHSSWPWAKPHAHWAQGRPRRRPGRSASTAGRRRARPAAGSRVVGGRETPMEEAAATDSRAARRRAPPRGRGPPGRDRAGPSAGARPRRRAPRPGPVAAGIRASGRRGPPGGIATEDPRLLRRLGRQGVGSPRVQGVHGPQPGRGVPPARHDRDLLELLAAELDPGEEDRRPASRAASAAVAPPAPREHPTAPLLQEGADEAGVGRRPAPRRRRGLHLERRRREAQEGGEAGQHRRVPVGVPHMDRRDGARGRPRSGPSTAGAPRSASRGRSPREGPERPPRGRRRRRPATRQTRARAPGGRGVEDPPASGVAARAAASESLPARLRRPDGHAGRPPPTPRRGRRVRGRGGPSRRRPRPRRPRASPRDRWRRGGAGRRRGWRPRTGPG